MGPRPGTSVQKEKQGNAGPSGGREGVRERERRRARRTAVSELDLRIVEALRQNGRAPSLEIARTLGVPDGLVRARIRDLEESGTIRIVGHPNPFHFGFTFDAILALNVEFGALPRVSAHLATLPEIIVSVALAGRYDLFAWTILRDRAELNALLRRLAEVPGIRSCETLIVLRTSKFTMGRYSVDNNPPWAPFRPLPPGEEVTLDDLDRQICERLSLAGRAPSADIARQLGAAPSTVHRKLRRLLDQGTMRIEILPNHAAFGFEVEAEIGIRARVDRVADVTRALAALPAVTYLARVTGQYHLVATVVVSAFDDLRAFLDVDLPRVGGIEAVEPLVWLEVHKFLPGRMV